MRAIALTATLYVVMHFMYAYVDMSWDIQSMIYMGLVMGLINGLGWIAGEPTDTVPVGGSRSEWSLFRRPKRHPMKFTVGIGTVRPQTIEAAARSIRRQTWRDWELIVVGQGSDPALPEVGERLQASDPRIQYVHLDRAGVCRARNAVIRHTGGDVIALMDDDCEAAPDWLATVAGYMEADRSIGLVGGALVCPPKPRLALSTCPVLIPAETLYDPISSAWPGAGGLGLDRVQRCHANATSQHRWDSSTNGSGPGRRSPRPRIRTTSSAWR